MWVIYLKLGYFKIYFEILTKKNRLKSETL